MLYPNMRTHTSPPTPLFIHCAQEVPQPVPAIPAQFIEASDTNVAQPVLGRGTACNLSGTGGDATAAAPAPAAPPVATTLIVKVAYTAPVKVNEPVPAIVNVTGVVVLIVPVAGVATPALPTIVFVSQNPPMVKNATVKVSPTAPVTVVLAAGGKPANKQEKPETRKDAGDAAAACATGAPTIPAEPIRVTIDSVARKFFIRTGLRTDITDFQPLGGLKPARDSCRAQNEVHVNARALRRGNGKDSWMLSVPEGPDKRNAQVQLVDTHRGLGGYTCVWLTQ